MRIDELHLAAVGPFTDQALDFARGREGFHVVYGSNEAGKSSALRALRSMLYGIPTRTRDDFVHPYAKMRIGATLRSSSGSVLQLIRRKGRSNTLRGADDETVIDEQVLARFLKGIDEDLFSTMFGIGYEDLVQGGQEIIQGGGNLGRLIFSAGSGIANLREIQNELQAAADALFRPSGQKPAINEMLRRWKTLQSDLREAQLPGHDWEAHQQTLQRAQARKAEVAQELTRHQTERSRLQRIQEALPLIARRNELMEALSELGDVPDLPADFSEKRQSLVTRLGVEEKEKERTSRALASIEASVAELNISTVLLDHADVIEALYQELGSHRKAAKDRIHLETMRDASRREAGEILRALREDIKLEDAERLRVRKDRIVLIQELGNRYERIMARMEDVREKLPEMAQAIDNVKHQLAGLTEPLPVQDLQAVLSEAEAYGPLETSSRADQAEIAAILQSLEKERQRLGLGEKELDDIESLAVPNKETVRQYEVRLDALDQSLKEIQKEMDQTRERLQETGQKIEMHCLEQDVPSQEELEKVRAVRDRGLQLIARRLGGEDLPPQELDDYLDDVPGAKSLLDAFSFYVKKADTAADRLRREADRVADHARLKSDQHAWQGRLAQLMERRTATASSLQAMTAEWGVLWRATGIDPGTPREMAQWLQDQSSLTEKLADVRARRARADRMTSDIDSHRQRLMQSMQAVGALFKTEAALVGLINRAAQVVGDQEVLQRKRSDWLREEARLEKEQAAAVSRIRKCEADIESWQREWAVAVQPMGLPADALPAQATTVLEELKTLFDKLKDAGILQKRIQGIDRDRTEFDDNVSRLADAVSAELKNRPPDEIVVELQRRLKDSRDDFSRRQTFEKQLEKERRRLSQVYESVAAVQAGLIRMCQEAGCRDHGELPEIEGRAKRHRELTSSLKDAESQLRQISGGATVEDFVTQARSVDPDEMEGGIQRLNEKIEELVGFQSEQDQVIGREQNELDRMDGSARAAVIAEEIQFLSGGIAHAAEQYARLRLAGKVLSMAIERYRDKSQGPILERASQHFQQITAGSFSGLRAEYDAGGHPVLVGVRQGNGEIVGVEGMSDGTADQLYLALRLAGLETYLEKNEPMPFIVDDILIKFDNERAGAALRVLAKLSEKTQVIFFTHHRHLMELAEAHVDASLLFGHRLG